MPGTREGISLIDKGIAAAERGGRLATILKAETGASGRLAVGMGLKVGEKKGRIDSTFIKLLKSRL